MRNLYLIGMPGSGKTVTGQDLASLLGMKFVDLDREIEAKVGRSIPEIFKISGEPYFRRIETDCLREAALKPSEVIATGGGVVLQTGNHEIMKRTGKIIYLEASEAWLWLRVKDDDSRPLLKTSDPLESLRELLKHRKPFYEKICDMRINTDDKSSDDVATEILKQIAEDRGKHSR